MREGKDHQSWLSGQLVNNRVEGKVVTGSLATSKCSVTIRPKADQDPSKLRMSRTPLGVHPRSLLDSFGVANCVVEGLVAALVPWCSDCNVKAVRRTVDSVCISEEVAGFFVLGIAEHDAEVSLTEQLELLGLDRAVINGSLVHRDDLLDVAVGEPVVAIHAGSERESMEQSVERWFERGGGPLRLYQFADRHSSGRLLGEISNSWGCETCVRSFAVVTLGSINAFSECARCRGEAWLEQRTVSGGVAWQECGECLGIGFTHNLTNYKVGEVPYFHLRGITFGELEEHLVSYVAESAKFDVRLICRSGFADYPIAAPVELLSDGEKALLTMTIAALSGYRGAPLVVDLAALGLQNDKAADAGSEIFGSGVPLSISATPTLLSEIPPGAASDEWIAVTGTDDGVLSFESLRFPVGEVSLITGPSGTGKSFLLREIIGHRFTRRKKLSTLCHFGPCNELLYVDPLADESITLGCLLGLTSSIAKSYSSTNSARLFGYEAVDFLPKKTVKVIALEQSDDFDWRRERVTLNSVTYPKLLACDLPTARKVLWADDLVDLVLSRLSDDLAPTWNLGMSVTEIPLPHRRFLLMYSALLRFLIPNKSSSKRSSVLRPQRPLILLDRPFAVSPQQGTELRRLMSEVCLRGGTVICADSLQGVESGFNYVVRLSPNSGGRVTAGEKSSVPDGKLLHQQLCRSAVVADVLNGCAS